MSSLGYGYSDLLHLPYLASRTYMMYDGPTAVTAITAVDIIYFYPFRIFQPIVITAGQIRVSAGGAGSSAKVGIWANSVVSQRPLGAPLLVDNTGVTTQSATDKTPAFSGTLNPGYYWSGQKYTGTLPTMYCTSGSQLGGMMGASSAIALGTGISFADAYANSMPTLAEGASFTAVASGVPLLGLTT